MTEAFLDSSVLIGLHFRHAGEKAACRKCLPAGCQLVTSRYVIYEIARGFLRSLIELHNASLEYSSLSDLHMAAYSGQRRFQPYKMHTWLGAMTDFQAKLEIDNGPLPEAGKLDMLRATLRGMVRRGWRDLLKGYLFTNEVSCRQELPEPSLNVSGQLVQTLPLNECGKPLACGIQHFIHERIHIVTGLAAYLESLPLKLAGKDTRRHTEGLRHLLQNPPGQVFEGRKCHRCGDAVICLEAPANSVIATKNESDFNPIVTFLGKSCSVAKSATSTVPSTNAPKI